MDAQNPIVVGPTYSPQPDIALLRTREDYYASATPTASDCLAVIEVADTTEYDRQIKMPRYAHGGVVELWLVDLERDVLVVRREPAGDVYQQTQVLRRGDDNSLAALAVTIAIDRILA